MAAHLTFDAEGTPLRVTIETLIIAGWTGRDPAAVQHHIAELAALGVPAPSTVPLYYRVSADLMTATDDLQVLGAESSGEAEPLLLNDRGVLWLGLGSDHTDRGLETVSVAHSKQVCGKPVAPGLWRFDDLAERLDDIELASFIRDETAAEWTPYQKGTLAAIRPLRELIGAFPDGLSAGTAMFCGTLTAIGGVRPARHFRMELRDPATSRRLVHSYRVTQLPVAS